MIDVDVFSSPSRAPSSIRSPRLCAPAPARRLAQAAEKRWHRRPCHNRLPKVLRGVKSEDGVKVVRPDAQTAAAGSRLPPKFGGRFISTPSTRAGTIFALLAVKRLGCARRIRPRPVMTAVFQGATG